ncbi:GNAT family N-acetyltransferase [Flavobacterium poyangense]|uniref:GNAT family N-acetyltransferase n=1 Tax=Flavobacterium poyangense TaxID=2204302 RepID=UPI0014204ED0|nr:GNAT family N-acetyltransferase [Flavobacterium sp. JXAS1]
MKNSNLVERNIDNLTGLWKTVSTPSLSYHQKDTLEYSKIDHSGWPNKLWLRQDISENDAQNAVAILRENSGLAIPYFDIYNSDSYKILESKGLILKSEQVAMALKLDQKFTLEKNLGFKRVTTEKDAEIWADLYPNAFGYVISKEILIQNHTRVHFYLVSLDQQPIGTLMFYLTDHYAGIHGLGVIPEMRRKGLAEEIMKFALNLSIDLKAEYALLQASAMGKDIYTRLGFEDLFVIKNYIVG